ncbi:hypothetical protein FACS1894166_10090 [Bacilli bacterium]|nr:hypothetical protein FACS1894166_10090 [Bacilli bacterium]
MVQDGKELEYNSNRIIIAKNNNGLIYKVKDAYTATVDFLTKKEEKEDKKTGKIKKTTKVNNEYKKAIEVFLESKTPDYEDIDVNNVDEHKYKIVEKVDEDSESEEPIPVVTLTLKYRKELKEEFLQNNITQNKDGTFTFTVPEQKTKIPNTPDKGTTIINQLYDDSNPEIKAEFNKGVLDRS